MEHIEKYIKNTWNKVPDDFKARVKYGIGVGMPESQNLYGIWFDINEIDRRLQKEVNEIVISALSKFYGFDEDEAHELLRKISR